MLRLHSGRLVDPTAMTLDDLDIQDIAHSLSRLCRFNGHCRGFISVARHSIDVVRQVGTLTALLHDASEAYLGDMVTDLKHSSGFLAYREAEDRLERLIAEKWGTKYPIPASVKAADLTVRVAEQSSDRWDTIGRDEVEFLAMFDLLKEKP